MSFERDYLKTGARLSDSDAAEGVKLQIWEHIMWWLVGRCGQH